MSKTSIALSILGTNNFLAPQRVQNLVFKAAPLRRHERPYPPEALALLSVTIPATRELKRYMVNNMVLYPGPPKVMNLRDILGVEPSLYSLDDFDSWGVFDGDTATLTSDVVTPGWKVFSRNTGLLGEPGRDSAMRARVFYTT